MAVETLDDLIALTWANELGALVFQLQKFQLMTTEMGIVEKAAADSEEDALFIKESLDKLNADLCNFMEGMEEMKGAKEREETKVSYE